MAHGADDPSRRRHRHVAPFETCEAQRPFEHPARRKDMDEKKIVAVAGATGAQGGGLCERSSMILVANSYPEP